MESRTGRFDAVAFGGGRFLLLRSNVPLGRWRAFNCLTEIVFVLSGPVNLALETANPQPRISDWPTLAVHRRLHQRLTELEQRLRQLEQQCSSSKV